MDQKIIDDFKHDNDLWQEINGIRNPGTTMKTMKKRHLFNMPINKQFLLACKEFNFKRHEDLHNLAKQISMTNMSTQLVEDINGEMKNASAFKSCRRFRKPATSWATALQKDRD